MNHVKLVRTLCTYSRCEQVSCAATLITLRELSELNAKITNRFNSSTTKLLNERMLGDVLDAPFQQCETTIFRMEQRSQPTPPRCCTRETNFKFEPTVLPHASTVIPVTWYCCCRV